MKTSNLIKYLGGGAALLVAFYALFGFYGVPELAKWGLQKYGAKFDANLSVGEVKFNPFTSRGEVVSVFTFPYLSAWAPALGEAKGLIDFSR